ncbi:thioredoxin domain-containing protein [Microbacterium sp. NPDC096154]|uniref:DsbA family protein n=1 Tax=Microbacterium sp. NPDC096154 TaxID=3155549 RepID=UPI00332AB305
MANGKTTNWAAIWISAGVVVLLVVVGGLVVWMNNQASAPASSPGSAVVDEETGAIAVGEGENVIDEYVDFMCPICGEYNELYGETVHDLVEEGRVTLNLHPISILDRYSQGTEYSTRSAAAAYCVADANPEAVYPFFQELFDNQPEEGSTGLSDDELSGFASDAGAPDAAECIASDEYHDYVTQITEETPVQPGAQGIGTPTVLLNGEFVSLTGDPQADIVAQLK